jgi:hypothetical protein
VKQAGAAFARGNPTGPICSRGLRRAAAGFLTAVLALLLIAPAVAGRVLIVNPRGGGDYPTIQGAISGSSDGDSILLVNATFRGLGNRDLDFLGKEITIASQGNDPSQCIINCEGSVGAPHSAFLFRRGEGSGSILQGIKIVNGYSSRGGAILCRDSSPTLRGLVISNNAAEEGGGIACERASPWIESCVFERNFVVNNGGGILCGTGFGDNAAPAIHNCTFTNNDAFAGGGIHCAYSYPEILGCTFRENTAVSGGALSCYLATPAVNSCLFQANSATVGGAVWCERASSPTITACTFAMNEATSRAAGVYSKDSSPVLRNTIIAWSVAGEAVYSRSGPFVPELSCCDLYANRGGDWVGAIEGQRSVNGNISSNPIFCNRWIGNFTIAAASACAPAQAGTCGLIGAFGVGCTEVPVERSTWGRIRAGFR